MLYLITQIVLILVAAVLAGLGIGWWSRGKLPCISFSASKTLPDDPFDSRFRLEQCHRDNATLRRDLKEAEDKLEKLQVRMENTENTDGDMLEKLETAEIRVQALLEDLQMRDDTIAVLENELELLRQKG
jgi:septal ring factor EnvC (AmiA/AmiB activator)